MQTRLSVCNQVLFLTLGKGFGKKLQALLRYLWPRPAAWVLAPIPHPKAPLTPQPRAGRCLLRSAQGKRNPRKEKAHIFVERSTTPWLTGEFLGDLPTHRARESCFKPRCVPREAPRHPGSEAPRLNMSGIFRRHQFKFVHQPYKYESPSQRDV